MIQFALPPEKREKLEELAKLESADFASMTAVLELDPAHAFQGADLQGVDLSGEDLSGFDFSDADFANANLQMADFRHAAMRGAQIEAARISGAFWPGRVLMNIRRRDAGKWLRPIEDALQRRFGPDRLEKKPRKSEIDAQVAQCGAVALIIGPRWGELIAKAKVDQRMLELDSALRQGVPIAPILLGETKAPAKSSLPAPLRQLADLKHARLNPADLERHLTGALDHIEQALARSATRPLG